MAVQKRHIIFIPDEEWERLRVAAVERGVSISELIRRGAKAELKKAK